MAWQTIFTKLALFLPQPLKVMDPDHPLAALIRKAKQERNGTAAMAATPEEVPDPAVSSTPAEYTTDREYRSFFSSVNNRWHIWNIKTLRVLITLCGLVYFHGQPLLFISICFSPSHIGFFCPTVKLLKLRFFLRWLLTTENCHLTSSFWAVFCLWCSASSRCSIQLPTL